MKKVCLECREALPPALFRRWRGEKIVTHSVCNRCAPPKKLSEMTPKQRLNAMARKQALATPTLVMQMNEREKQRFRREVLAQHKYAHNQTLRRAHWNAAITDAVRKELRWARSQGRGSAYGTKRPINSGESFFPAYIALLKRMVDILSRKPLIKGAPIKPTMEEANPATYIPAHTRVQLLELYAQEKPVTRRSPAILAWCK